MSLKDQIALGKNTQLQRRYEDTCVSFRRALRQSRRRLDNMEEECVASLYKLMIDAKEHQASNEPPTGDGNTKPISKVTRIQSAGVMHQRTSANENTSERQGRVKRPATTMSVRNYVQSYSFVKDGMNIARNRKDRYVKSKKEEAKTQQQVVIARQHAKRPTISIDRPPTSAAQQGDSERKKETSAPRPMTCIPYSTRTHKKLIKRPQETRNHFTDTCINDGNIVAEQNQDDLDKIHSNKVANEYNGEHKSVASHNQEGNDQEKQKHYAGEKNVTDHDNNCIRPPEVGAAKKSLSTEDLSDKGHYSPSTHSTTSGSDSVASGHGDDVAETQANTKITTSWPKNKNIRSKSAVLKSHTERIIPLRNTKSRLSTYDVIPADADDTLKESTKKTHNFLTQYAKKSKLFGYVVNATASSTAPRNKNKKIYRSPCVTYQELVSIKANIKRHETQTRMMLQRSEQLKNYVWRLSNAGVYREFKASGQ